MAKMGGVWNRGCSMKSMGGRAVSQKKCTQHTRQTQHHGMVPIKLGLSMGGEEYEGGIRDLDCTDPLLHTGLWEYEGHINIP